MKKCTAIIISLILLLSFTSCARTETDNQDTTSSNVSTVSKPAIYSITKSTFTDIGIAIYYPQISGLPYEAGQKEINNILKTEALSVLKHYEDKDNKNELPTGLDLECYYEITYQSPDILSVAYLTYANVEGSAHPTDLFNTANIDIYNAKKIKLKDTININNEFIEAFKNGTYKYNLKSPNSESLPNYEMESAMLSRIKDAVGDDVYSNENLINKFTNADNGFPDDTYCYFTKDSLGISISTAHVLGDHAEFEIAYNDLTNFLKPDGIISKSIGGNKNLNFPFKAPNFGNATFENGSYVFNNVTSQELDYYIESLRIQGYMVEKSDYSYYLEKDNVFIRITNNTINYKQFNLEYYEGMTNERAGALKCSDAIELIGNKTVAAIEINVPDLYEKTGAQLFYSVSTNQDSMSVWPLKYIIMNQKVFSLDTIYDDFLMCDIDVDGKNELLYLADGGTSGVFSFVINAIGFEKEDLTIKYSTFFSNMDYYAIKLQKVSDTEMYLCSSYYSNEVLVTGTRLYKIEIENNKIALNELAD